MLAELAPLVGMQLQRVVQPDVNTVCLRLMRGWLLLGVQMGSSRMHLMAERPRELPAQAPAFCMLLRKVLLNSRLARVERMEGDRVVRLGTTAGELVAELTPRRANLLLLDAHGILLGNLLPLRKDLGAGELYTAPRQPPGRPAPVPEPRWTS